MKRGTSPTFRPDQGEAWSAEVRFDGGGKALRPGQAMHLKRPRDAGAQAGGAAGG